MNLFKRKKPQEPLEAKLPEIGLLTSKGRLVHTSETWLFVEQWAVSKIKYYRERNDNPNLGLAETAEIRGRIRQLKDLLELPSDSNRDTIFKNGGGN